MMVATPLDDAENRIDSINEHPTKPGSRKQMIDKRKSCFEN
jgi:hypothetical protein